jgi:hypothetical protein
VRKLLIVIGSILILAGGTAWADGVVLNLPPEDQQRINTLLGPGVVGEAMPSEPIGDPSVYFPLHGKAMSYLVTSGPHQGRQETLNLEVANRPSGQHAWRFQFSASLAGYLHQSPEGDITMPAVADTGQGLVVISSPANPFIAKGMKPGETRQYDQNVKVNYLDDPTDQKYSGALSGTYTYIGTYQVTVPAGTFNAVLFRVKFGGKVGPAHTKDIQYNFFAPGVGVVAMITQEDVEAFWIYNVDSSSGKVLLSK